MKPSIPIQIIFSALLFTCADAWGQSSIATRQIQAAERAALFPSSDMLEQGRNIAETSCSGCHGVGGISEKAEFPHLAGQRTVYLYRVLQAYQNGYRIDESMGHAGGFLNDEGLLSVAAYYASLPPARRPLKDNTSLAVPEKTEVSTAEPDTSEDPFSDIRPALKKCAKCHKETGNSSASGMPNLTAQDPEYFLTSMQAYVDGGRNHKMMKRLVDKLDEQTIREMGVYYAVQEPQQSDSRGDGDEVSGRRLAENCSNCHGDDGNASAADMPSLALCTQPCCLQASPTTAPCMPCCICAHLCMAQRHAVTSCLASQIIPLMHML